MHSVSNIGSLGRILIAAGYKTLKSWPYLLHLLSLITRHPEFRQVQDDLVSELCAMVTRLLKRFPPSSLARRLQTLGSSQDHLLTELCPDTGKRGFNTAF